MNWWSDYFSEVWEPLSHLIKVKRDTALECNFLEQLMVEFGHSSLLDIPSGSGRIALEMAKRGFDATGIDQNETAIEKAKLSAQKIKKNRPQFQVGDMRKMHFNHTFDTVICAYNSFGYFSEKDNADSLVCMGNALSEKGFLLLENHVLETLLPVFTPKEYWQYEDYILFEERVFDFQTSRLKGNWTLVDKKGERKHFQSSVRIYSYLELTRLLKTAGFVHFEPYGSYLGEPFEFGDDLMLLLAIKGK